MTCSTQEEAAGKVGINRRTLSRWMREPAFQDAYRAARRSAFSQVISRVERAATKAVSVLEEILSKRAGNSIKVRAAAVILENLRAGIQLDSQEAAIERLERKFDELANSNQKPGK